MTSTEQMSTIGDAVPFDGAEQAGEPDPGMVRAGAAAAARRRELDISQRSLATAGIINAGALIAFEKGRSWPRKGTRSKLEEVLRWPEGAIARIRRGDPISGDPETPTLTTDGPQEDRPEPDGAAALIAQAILAAVERAKARKTNIAPMNTDKLPPRVEAEIAAIDARRAAAKKIPST